MAPSTPKAAATKAVVLLALVAFALVGSASAETCHTYVNNKSSKTVLGTLSCAGWVCKSKFQHREIAPGKQGDLTFRLQAR